MRRSITPLLLLALLINTPSVLAQPTTAPVSARDQARREAEVAISRRLLDQAIGMAEGTVKQYQTIETQHEGLRKRLSELMSNDEGKRLAATLDPVLAREIVNYLDTPVLDPARLAANQKQAEALLTQLRRERENLAPGYVPPEAIISESHSLSNWANEAASNIQTRHVWLDEQLAIVPKEFDAASAKTLGDVLSEFRRREHEAWAAARRQGAEQAAPEGQAAIADATRTAELERMLQEARHLLEQTRTDLEQQAREQEAALARQKDAYEQMMADLRRELATSQAQRGVQDAQTEGIAKQGDIDAEKVRLRQEAQDPALRELLAPLLAKGFSQPGKRDRELDARPVSFSALRDYGALERSEKGLQQLAKVASKRLGTGGSTYTNRNWDRPTWGGPESWRDWSNDQRQRLLKAQDALNRLGPTFVELGLLAE